MSAPTDMFTHDGIEIRDEVPPEAAAEALDAIETKRRELNEAFREAARLHELAVESTEAATATANRLKRALGASGIEMALISREIEAAERDGIEQTLSSVGGGGRLTLSRLVKTKSLRTRHEAASRFSVVIAEDRLPLAEEAVMAAQIEEMLAQAERIERLADQRQIETELHLAAIAAEEGDAVLDENKTRTGLLRQEAARLKMQAGILAQALRDRREERIAAVERRINSLGRL